jgi:hypothetical protein
MLNQGGNAYFKANPDVAAAFAKDAYGMSADAFASTHFNKFGATEGRVAPAPAAMPSTVLSAGAAYAAKPGGIGAAKFDQNIRDYLAVNPTATAAQKRTEMDLYGISDQDVSRATMPVAPVVARNSPSIAAPAPSPTGLITQGSRSYFQANPDVAEAFSKDSFGMTESQFADTHFTKFGAAEGRASPASVAVPKTTLSAGMTYASRQGGIGADAYYSNIRNWANSTPGATESDRQREMQAYGVSEEDWSRSGAVLRPALVAAPVAAPPPSYAGPTSREVAPQETIEGRIRNLLGTDAQGNYTNPVVQQAANRAMQSMAGRGLLNSSMAQQAAIEAATGKAIEIAGPDAQTYFSQGRANQDATNVFSRDGNSRTFDGLQLDKRLAQDESQFGRNLNLQRDQLTQSGSQFDRNLNQNATQFDVTSGLQRDQLTQSGSQFDRNLNQNATQFDVTSGLQRDQLTQSGSQFDRNLNQNATQFDVTSGLQRDQLNQNNAQFNEGLALDKDKLTQSGSQFNSRLNFDLETRDLEVSTRVTATELAHKHALQINSISSVNTQYDLYLNRVAQTDNNPAFDADTKVKLKNEAGAEFDIFSKQAGIVFETMGGRYTVAAPAANTTAPTGATGGMLSQGDNFA